MRSPKSRLHELCANIAPVAASISVATYGAEPLREVPSTHSRYAVTERRLVCGEWLVSVRREILIESSAGTNCSKSSAMPRESCAQRE